MVSSPAGAVVVSSPTGAVVSTSVGGVVSTASTRVKFAVAVVLVSIHSTLTMYWSGLRSDASTSKDHLFAPSPFSTTTLPEDAPKPEASVFVVGPNAAEVTSTISLSPTAALVVPVIVNLLPASLVPIGSMKMWASSMLNVSFT